MHVTVFNLYGQQRINPTEKNSDCKSAIVIHDTVVVSDNSPKGFGSNQEIIQSDKSDTTCFEKEHNTVWLYFTAKSDGYLTFDVVLFQ